MHDDASDAVRLRPAAHALAAEPPARDGWETLERMYVQCLWLGEAHTPLRAFLDVLHSVEAGARRVVHLVRTPAELRARFPAWTSASIEALRRGEGPSSRSLEVDAMQAAAVHGPLARTAHEPGALAQFTLAMHCREAQLQLVLVAWLLSRRALGDASLAADPAPPSAAPAPKKRKTSKPTRWNGLAPALPFAFAWDTMSPRASPAPSSRPRTADAAPSAAPDAHAAPSKAPARESDAPSSSGSPSASHTPQPSTDEPDPPYAARLALLPQLWDQLGDQLCLLECAPPSSTHAAYGSASRLRDAQDMRDEAQWVCAAVLEPAFRKTLPKECARLRAKCFGPGPGADVDVAPRSVARRLKRTKSAPAQPVEKPKEAAARSDERTMIRADRRQREVHMPRQFKRSPSVSVPSLHTAPASKRKRPASRWGVAAEAHTLVCATPEKPKGAPPVPLALGSPSPSPSPPMSPLQHSALSLGARRASESRAWTGSPEPPGQPAVLGEGRAEFEEVSSATAAAAMPPPAATASLFGAPASPVRSAPVTNMPGDAAPPAAAPALAAPAQAQPPPDAHAALASDSDEELVLPAWRKAAFVPTSLPYL
ncbi:hypothetical protein GLX27_002922 [Malassezia furfur]|uniref:DNA replication regulator Sld3 C-terminal domain-containing protein n=1 Tax=Malassezia furfur TaxID=55194 RepID=A0ABY8ES03_MALFU|nr:hypothetical protein GLX27_002922 [Malassezia furfur]